MWLRRLPSVPPVLLTRAVLDLTLVASWVGLAGEVLPDPVPALGAALFGGVSAWFWATFRSTAARQSVARPAPNEVNRIEAFTRRQTASSRDESAPTSQEIELWLEDEARRCTTRGLSLAIVFLRVETDSLVEWAGRSPPKSLRDILSKAGEQSEIEWLIAMTGTNEAIIGLIGGGRAEAEDALQRVHAHLGGRKCEAGIVVHPSEGIEPSALAALARLRAKPLYDRPNDRVAA